VKPNGVSRTVTRHRAARAVGLKRKLRRVADDLLTSVVDADYQIVGRSMAGKKPALREAGFQPALCAFNKSEL